MLVSAALLLCLRVMLQFVSMSVKKKKKIPAWLYLGQWWTPCPEVRLPSHHLPGLEIWPSKTIANLQDYWLLKDTLTRLLPHLTELPFLSREFPVGIIALKLVLVQILKRYGPNTSSESDFSSAGTVEGSRNVSSVFICMPALPPFITHSNLNDSVCLHVRADGRWNDNSSYFHPGRHFSLVFFNNDGRNVAPNLLNRHWWGNSLCARFSHRSSPPHRADFTEIKQDVSQPTGRTDVRRTHWTQNVRLPDWRHMFKLQIQAA